MLIINTPLWFFQTMRYCLLIAFPCWAEGACFGSPYGAFKHHVDDVPRQVLHQGLVCQAFVEMFSDLGVPCDGSEIALETPVLAYVGFNLLP